MLKGKIISINKAKYVVKAEDKKYNCLLRGIFRKEKITPLVGDQVLFDENKLIIEEFLPRNNYLLRPNIANVDIALIITSVKDPDLDLNLLDKLLVSVIKSNITPIICFTKVDLLKEKESFLKIKDYYEQIGIKTLINDEIEKFNKLVSKKEIVCCGQTGSGKSSFINKLAKNLNLKTSPISKSLNRGVHTTRAVNLYEINDYFIADTPGFSALDLVDITKEEIKDAFLEFKEYTCKYKDCDHINTDGCKVACEIGKKILLSRYENYVKFIKEQNENSRKLFKK